MPLDPQVQQVLEQLDELGLPPNYMISPEEARTNMMSKPRPDGPEVAKVEDRTIANGDFQVPVRIYNPEGSGPFPVLIWFHGGGWVIGNLETADEVARHLTVGAECVVVSVDYRLAPEAKLRLASSRSMGWVAWVISLFSSNGSPGGIRRMGLSMRAAWSSSTTPCIEMDFWLPTAARRP